MTRSKLGLLGLCAVVLGMMAISAASAQGATLDWLVLNAAGTVATLVQKEPNGTVNLLAAVTGKIDTLKLTLLTHLVGLKVGVSCTAFTTSGISLEPEGKLSEGGKVVFTGCSVSEGDTKCTVKSPGAATGTIESGEGKGEIVLHELAGGAKDVLTKIEPKAAGGTFATLRFEGECSLPESNAVKGVLFVKDCEGFATTHKVKHLIEQGPLTSLTVGADTTEHLETSIDGSAWVELAGAHSGLAWAAMDTP
jgi:hypothetical protein